jgi:hypothetical protein
MVWSLNTLRLESQAAGGGQTSGPTGTRILRLDGFRRSRDLANVRLVETVGIVGTLRGAEVTMNTQEMFEKNQRLSTEFDLYLLDHPEVAEQIPDGALLVFVPANKSDPPP